MTNLIELKQTLSNKNQQRSKFIGRKDLLMESLLELGFKSKGSARKKWKQLKSDNIKMKKQYDSKLDKFTEKYEHLLL